MANDPYAVLGIQKNADEAEIKSAYRKLAKQHHPDLNPDNKGAASRFQEIGAAYALLSDKDKRAAFDRGDIDMEGQPRQQKFYRDHAQGPQGGRYYNNTSSTDDIDPADLSDLFSSMFGRRGAEYGAPFGEPDNDVRYTIEIDFLEAALGGNKRVTMPDGRSLEIAIPEGIKEGQQLRLKGQGKKGKTAGDAYVQIHIRPHPRFTRDGNDVRSELPIGFHESILGSKVQAETLHGPVEVTIPKGAGSGATLRLKGKGIKGGDQYVTLRIIMPPVIDAELEEAVLQWSQKHGYNPRKEKTA